MVRLVDMACKKVGMGCSMILDCPGDHRGSTGLSVKEMVLAELEIILEDAMTLSN